MSIKILICDDDSLIRESLKIILPIKGDIEVIGEASNGRECINFCLENEIDVALIDIRMPVVNGVEAVREIVKKTKTKCLVLTTFDEEDYINEALLYGAKGYILKNNSPEQIVNSIVSVYNNTIVMNENILDKLHGKEMEPEIKKYDFTDREIEIIKAISEGLSNKEISNKLFISEGTIRNYITTILDKTGLEHRTALAVNYLKGNL
ncbi:MULTISPECIES: response regulator transcription factor [unclassified Clostridium]|uniref:response regulator transcription factor n=1 Tax=unclassified Clostridium TaxID=2614128 RepID=UPI000297F6ED|nr:MULTISPECIES: response regulator transcription factor [unclassified Clostridium]EKQ50883.1 MAG: response regulator (CheY-like receiver and HTH DNA-binding domain containing protein) [Clostridium sp. Maddingley MBC34-26]